MLDIIKNYFLWPCLAILSMILVYLTLVIGAHRALILINSEESIWNLLNKMSLISTNNEKSEKFSLMEQKIQALVDSLPVDFTHYPRPIIIISNDSNINAFAAPGNRIIFTTGLLDILKTENALLFILAHEMAHLSRKDHLYECARLIVSKLYALLTRSELLAKSLFLADNFKTQNKEFYSDRLALYILDKHYGHASGAEEFFQILLTRNHDKIAGSIFSNHPTTKNRLERLNNFIKEFGLKQGKTISLYNIKTTKE